MLPETKTLRRKLPALSAILAVALVALALQPAAGDDRSTLRRSAGNPYVFILLDTSGSMNWAPPCSAADFAAGKCPFLCPTGDCYVPLNGDDPSSKIYSAKAALAQVLSQQPSVHFGFGSYNQDGLGLRGKHYLYQAATNGPSIAGFGNWPTASATNPWQEVFGLFWGCNSGTGDNQAGCAPTTPADVTRTYQLTRVKRLPKGDAAFNAAQTIYVLVSGSTYKVVYTPAAGTVPGAASISVNVNVAKCTNSTCSSTTGSSTVAVTWNRVTSEPQTVLVGTTPTVVQTPVPGDFVSWDIGGGGNPQETDPATDYFQQTQAADAQPTNTCAGWDPNTDNTADASSGYDIRQPTNSSDPRGAFFTVGDVIPWDWTNSHNLDIQKRLAPNLELTPSATPDFSIASYFNNTPWTGETFLRIPTGNNAAGHDTVTAKSVHAPLIAGGSTPIGASLQSFRGWFSGCTTTGAACPAAAGWKAVAAAAGTGDPLYKCSRKYVLFITDGDETCNTSTSDSKYPCTVAGDLKNFDSVFTYILGFGVASNPGNILNCVAGNGGTGTPIYPQNEQQLIDALNKIFGAINENPTAFASAAVPSVQAETADKLFLTSFFPLDPSDGNTNAGFWDGHVNAFLKPLPLTASGTPDTSRLCSALGGNPSSCLLWDAGRTLVAQAPAQTDVDSGNFAIGNGLNQRRVIYPQANPNGDLPSVLRTFTPPAGNAPSSDWNDLLCGNSASCPAGSAPQGGLAYSITATFTLAQAQAAALGVIKDTLKKKTAFVTFTDGNGNTTSFNEPYVLGDIFHSDPLFYSNPDNFLYYAADLHGNGAACTTRALDNPGYRCYAERHRKRRKMLVFGADDGELHAFDSGTWDTTVTPNDFNNGALNALGGSTPKGGTEIFAYVPRLALPVLRDQAAGSGAAGSSPTQVFSVDGTVRVDDVFIDPHHTAATGPVVANREWRTVLIGGMREGGKPNGGGATNSFVSGYYALDLTDPDPIDSRFVPTTTAAVPGCLSTASLNSPGTGCGTLPFPAALWEFTDSIAGSQLDEDLTATPGRGAPDLGQTWSVPTIGRIQVTENGSVVEKYVAIFGGGFDPNSKTIPPTTPTRGNWIYIVDVETGKAIYKHAVSGAVVGDPAVVDTNQDGFLDTVYFGTTSGFLYKMDLSFPETLQSYTLPLTDGIPSFTTAQTVKRVGSKTLATRWDPFKIFDTQGLPIYLAPTTFFVSALNQYAVAFGTGDREDLWNFAYNGTTQVSYTFNLILDEGFTSSTSGLPRNASNYKQIGENATSNPGSDFVLSPVSGNNRGWVMNLGPEERVITQAFGLGGVILFSTYTPDALQPDANSTCAFLGDSHNFVVFAGNADPVAVVNGSSTRFTVVTNKFVTNPFVEQGATKNAATANKNSEQLDATQQGILDTLKKFYPKNTKFANYWISVSGVRSDTGYVRYATIPIGIMIKNWKEY